MLGLNRICREVYMLHKSEKIKHKVLVVDVSGRSSLHDSLLCNAIADLNGEYVLMATPSPEPVTDNVKTLKLVSLIPSSSQKSKSLLKKTLRFIEILCNYIYIIFYVIIHKIDVIHFQWLPLLEYTVIEKYLIVIIRYFSSCSKILLSIHNVYPHNFPTSKKNIYKSRIMNIDRVIDGFIAHLNETKEEIVKEYNIDRDKIGITYLGLYPISPNLNDNTTESPNIKILMFGFHTFYKGTDILLNAIKAIPENIEKNISITIQGEISESYKKTLQDIKTNIKPKWITEFLDNKDLLELILQNDIVVLPYRKISQSGALLLALNFDKVIITSDLPSFKETLSTFEEEWFFKSEDPMSLSLLLQRYVNKEINIEDHIQCVKKLRNIYSWNNTARQTIDFYNK